MKFNAIMAVKLKERSELAAEVQTVLTEHGCIISSRLGLHEVENGCRRDGLITLFLDGSEAEINDLQSSLNEYDFVEARTLSLNF